MTNLLYILYKKLCNKLKMPFYCINILIIMGILQSGSGNKMSESIYATNTSERTQDCDRLARHFCIAHCLGLFDEVRIERQVCAFHSANASVLTTVKPVTVALPRTSSSSAPVPVVINNCSSQVVINNTSKMKVICSHQICATEDGYCDSIVNEKSWSYLINQCTHIVLYPFFEFNTSDTKKFKLFVNGTTLKNNGIPYLIKNKNNTNVIGAIVGTSEMFSKSLESRLNRTPVINIILKKIEEYELDGIEIRWRFPGCDEYKCTPETENKELNNFESFIQEFLTEVDKSEDLGDISVSCVIPNQMTKTMQAFNLAFISSYLDWIVVDTVEYNREVKNFTMLSSGLKKVEKSMKELNETEINNSKLIIKITTKNKFYELKNRKVNSIGAPTNPNAATIDQSFATICLKLKNPVYYAISIPNSIDSTNGLYLISYKNWLSYDDMTTIRAKMLLVKKFGFGGALLENTEGDDHVNHCQCGKYPLLRAINEELRGQQCQLNNCINE